MLLEMQQHGRLCVRFALRPSVPRTWLAGMSLEGSKWKTCANLSSTTPHVSARLDSSTLDCEAEIGACVDVQGET